MIWAFSSFAKRLIRLSEANWIQSNGLSGPCRENQIDCVSIRLALERCHTAPREDLEIELETPLSRDISSHFTKVGFFPFYVENAGTIHNRSREAFCTNKQYTLFAINIFVGYWLYKVEIECFSNKRDTVTFLLSLVQWWREVIGQVQMEKV